MARISLDLREPARTRFGRVQDAMGFGRAEMLGTLVLFWAETREREMESGTLDELRAAAPLSHERAERFVAALLDAGYVGAPDEAGIHPIVDNEGENARRAALREKGRRGGIASRAKASPKRGRPKKKVAPEPAGPALVIASDAAPRPAPTPLQLACARTWEAYRVAFYQRFGQDPVRNAKVNSLIVTFVQRLGHEESPAVLASYLQHPSPFYLERMYPLDLAVRDCEALRAQWATGQYVTRSQAQAQTSTDGYQQRMQHILNRGS